MLKIITLYRHYYYDGDFLDFVETLDEWDRYFKFKLGESKHYKFVRTTVIEKFELKEKT